jgi:hypothetical protein
MQNSVWYVVLGSFLAFITSLVSEYIKSRQKSRSDKKDCKIILKLELKSIVDSINRLLEDYGRKQFYTFVILNELDLKIQRLDKVRDKVVYIKNDYKKEEILFVFNDIYIFATDVRGLENNAFGTTNISGPGEVIPWNHDMYKSQRQMLAVKSVDLKRKIQDLIFYFDNK